MQKKSVQLMGHQTSVSLEPEFWKALKEIAFRKKTSLRQLIIEVDKKQSGNLASDLRVFVLKTLQEQATYSETETKEFKSG